MMSVHHRPIDRIMTRGEATVSWSDTAEVALARMQRLGCDHLAVIDADGVVIGLCKRKALLACQSHGDWLRSTSIVHLMRPGPLWCHEDASVDEVLALMDRLQADALAVLDQDRQVAGIVYRQQLLTRQNGKEQASAGMWH